MAGRLHALANIGRDAATSSEEVKAAVLCLEGYHGALASVAFVAMNDWERKWRARTCPFVGRVVLTSRGSLREGCCCFGAPWTTPATRERMLATLILPLGSGQPVSKSDVYDERAAIASRTSSQEGES